MVFTGGGGETFRRTSQKETVTRYGVGVEWNVTPRVALRAEYERFEKLGRAFAIGGSGTTGEADTDLVTASVLFRF